MAVAVVIWLPHSEQNGTFQCPRFGISTRRIGRYVILLAIAILAAMAVKRAEAKSWADAQGILSSCAQPMDSPLAATCMDYLEGVKDTLEYFRARNLGLRFPCSPPDMTLGQLRDVVSVFIRANPQYYHLDGARVVYAALVAAFPCQ
jgi:hypothetical protein